MNKLLQMPLLQFESFVAFLVESHLVIYVIHLFY